jgi:hypothetical protein
MKKVLSAFALCVLLSLGWSSPSGATNEGTCPEGGAWSAHFSANDQESFTYAAEGDFLIAEICVKAGSINQGYGPEFQSYDPPVSEVTFEHSSGKEISHFAVRLVPVTIPSTTVPETTTTLPETTTTVPDTVTSTTVPETTTTSSTTPATPTTAGPSTTVPDTVTTTPLDGLPNQLARTGFDGNFVLIVLGLSMAGGGLVMLSRDIRQHA